MYFKIICNPLNTKVQIVQTTPQPAVWEQFGGTLLQEKLRPHERFAPGGVLEGAVLQQMQKLILCLALAQRVQKDREGS